MLVLGLNFGHDAGVAVVRDGRILGHVIRERLTRVKHAGGLNDEIVTAALRAASVSLDDVDAVAVSSTQGVELLFEVPDQFTLGFRRRDAWGVPCTYLAQIADGELTPENLGVRNLAALFDSANGTGSWLAAAFAAMFPGYAQGRFTAADTTPFVDSFVAQPAWDKGAGLMELEQRDVDLAESLRYGFHLPVDVTLTGRTIPGHLVHHHLAHAANSYYTSGFEKAAVLSHDGHSDGHSYHTGMYYYGRGNALYPLTPHHLNLGAVYDRVGHALGLGHVGPAGKLMGLAAYGKPAFVTERFVGNFWDARDAGMEDLASSWLVHCRVRAKEAGYDLSVFGRPEAATAPINADIAASTQQLFEVVRDRAVEVLGRLLVRAGLSTDNLCLTGGTALNCPSNSRIAREGAFRRVYVEPTCDDSGIAVGAALAVTHSLLGVPLPATGEDGYTAFVGRGFSPLDVAAALEARASEVSVEVLRPDDVVARSVEDLLADRVVGWFEGRSEVGPRALCHRSLLADPRQVDNWARVNRVKGRESWRPFAPVVLEEEAREWFAILPLSSPYMLFNADVVKDTVPAVQHVDGTARIQTLSARDGTIHAVLCEFADRTGVPVLMNTSFNGPGEPIVDSPVDALATFLKLPIDVLYLDGCRVTRSVERGGGHAEA
jgi:carbamoyltransferase